VNKQEVKQIIMKGSTVSCTSEEYPDVRRYLQEIAGESIDTGQSIYAAIALAEVQRLDSITRVAEQWDGAESGTCPSCMGDKYIFNMDGMPIGDCPDCKGTGHV